MKIYNDGRERIERPFLNRNLYERYMEAFVSQYNKTISEKRKPLQQENRMLLATLKTQKPPKNKRKKIKARIEANRAQLRRDDHQLVKHPQMAAIKALGEAVIAQQAEYIKKHEELNMHCIDVVEGTYCLWTNNVKLIRILGHKDRSTAWRTLKRLMVIPGLISHKNVINDRCDYQLFIHLSALPFVEKWEENSGDFSAFEFPLLKNEAMRVPLRSCCKVQSVVTLRENSTKPVKAKAESLQSRDDLQSLREGRNTEKEQPKHNQNQEGLSKHLGAILAKAEENRPARAPQATPPTPTQAPTPERGATPSPLEAKKREKLAQFFALAVKMLYPGLDLNEGMMREVRKDFYLKYFNWIKTEEQLEFWFDRYLQALQKQKNYVAEKPGRFTMLPKRYFAKVNKRGGEDDLKKIPIYTFHGMLEALKKNSDRDKYRRRKKAEYYQERRYKGLVRKFYENRNAATYEEVRRKLGKIGPEFAQKFVNEHPAAV